MGYSTKVAFVGSIHDLQLVRPAEHENFGLSLTFVAPPDHNWFLADAMYQLSELDKTYTVSIELKLVEEDEQM